MAHTFPYCLPLSLGLPCVGLGLPACGFGYARSGSLSAVCGSARVWVWVCPFVGLGLPVCESGSAHVWVWLCLPVCGSGWVCRCVGLGPPCVGLGLPVCGSAVRGYVSAVSGFGSTVRGSGSAVCGSGSAVRGSVCRAWSGSICPCVGLLPCARHDKVKPVGEGTSVIARN